MLISNVARSLCLFALIDHTKGHFMPKQKPHPKVLEFALYIGSNALVRGSPLFFGFGTNSLYNNLAGGRIKAVIYDFQWIVYKILHNILITTH